MRPIVTVLALLAFASIAVSQFGQNFKSGYINVNQQEDANLFYYFVPSQSNPATDPIILWLQGGPGCSSLFGAWVEMGPFIIQPSGQFKANQFTWNKNASMLFIDSPVGTGFSTVKNQDYPTDEATIANDLYTFLQSFLFTLNPQLSKNPFYVFGESYGGKYVPWLAHTILTNNGNPKAGQPINLKAIGIGNGFVAPLYTTASYGPFLLANKKISSSENQKLHAAWVKYAAAIQAKQWQTADSYWDAILNAAMDYGNIGDVYDIRKASDPTTPYADQLQSFLNTQSARKSLGVKGNQQWELCETGPYFALTDDMQKTSEVLIPAILQQIPVMIYNGNYDLICDWMGTAAWSDAMTWPGQQKFLQAPNKTWAGANGQPAGTYKSAQNLVRVVVANAGHMSPFDQPANTQIMVWQFLNNLFQ